MAPGCDAWMCLKHSKYNYFLLDLQFAESLRFRCPGEALEPILGGFLSPVAHFFLFLRVLGEVGILVDF